MFHYDSTTSTWTTKTAPKFSQPSDRSLSTNETPTFTTPPAIPHSDSHLISPASASSSVKHSSSSIPVLPYTPTAPGYSPFSQQPDPSQPSSSQPPIAPLIEDIIAKLDDLKLNTTSTSMFNSASEQLFTLIRDYQTSSTMTLRRIEDKIDAFEDKMKGYGHHSYDCMQSILQAQQDMVDTQSNMKQLQLALLQELVGQFPKASSPAAKPTSSRRGFK